MGPDDPIARHAYFIIRAKAAKIPGDARYGLTATKRTFKRAVNRNRAKRLLREWVRFNERYLIPEYDYVFIARHSIVDTNPTRDQGRVAMTRALQYMQREYNQAKKAAKKSNANN